MFTIILRIGNTIFGETDNSSIKYSITISANLSANGQFDTTATISE